MIRRKHLISVLAVVVIIWCLLMMLLRPGFGTGKLANGHGVVDITIDEPTYVRYTTPCMPGGSYTDSVTIRNIAKPCRLRVSMQLSCEDAALDLSLIEIQVGDPNGSWQSDGEYYCFAGTLDTDESAYMEYTLLFSPEIDNSYQKKEIVLQLTAEAVADGIGSGSGWGICPGWLLLLLLLFLRRPVVIFNAEKGKFRIPRAALFPRFKNVMPGDVLRHKLRVRVIRAGESRVKMYMIAVNESEGFDAMMLQRAASGIHADAVLSTATKEPKAERPKLSEHFAAKNPVPLSVNKAMGELVDLGVFADKRKRTVEVKLAMPGDAGEEYAEMTGKTKWVFAAEVLPGEGSTDVLPRFYRSDEQ